MKQLTTIIIDDQDSNIETLEGLVKLYCPVLNIIGNASSVEAAFALINQYKPDLILLDIELGSASGFDLLAMFKQPFFKTIFTTAYSQYAIEAFRKQAADYLLKPIQVEHLQEAVAKVAAQIQSEDIYRQIAGTVIQKRKVNLPTLEGINFIDCDEIVYCEGARSYSIIYLQDNKKMVVSMKLKECEDVLPESIFFRVHNSYIVNTNYVEKYIRGKGGQVVLTNHKTLQLSQSRKDEFLKFMKHVR